MERQHGIRTVTLMSAGINLVRGISRLILLYPKNTPSYQFTIDLSVLTRQR